MDESPPATHQPRVFLTALLILGVALAGVGWVAWDARSEAARLQDNLAATETRVHDVEQANAQTVAALRTLAVQLRGVDEVDDKVADLEETLFGFLGPPPVGLDLIGDIESCLSSIAAYLDRRTSVFFCNYL